MVTTERFVTLVTVVVNFVIGTRWWCRAGGGCWWCKTVGFWNTGHCGVAQVTCIAFDTLATLFAHFGTLLVLAVTSVITITAVSFSTSAATRAPFLVSGTICLFAGHQRDQPQNELKNEMK